MHFAKKKKKKKEDISNDNSKTVLGNSRQTVSSINIGTWEFYFWLYMPRNGFEMKLTRLAITEVFELFSYVPST